MPLSLAPARLGVLLALGAVVGWSFNYIFSRSIVGIFPPFTFTLMRTAVALLVFAPFAGKEFLRCWPILRKRKAFYIALALSGIGYYNPLVYISGQTTTAANMSLLALCSPIFTLLLSRAFLGEALTPRRLIGLFAALCGVILLTTRGDIALLREMRFHTGDLVMLFAALMFACYTVALRYADTEAGGNAILFAIFAYSFVFLLPPAAWELSRGMPMHFTTVSVAGIVYLGVVASVLCYVCWNRAIALVGPSNTSMLYYALPLFSGLEAALLLGEPLHWFHFVSGVLIIAGVCVATRK